MTEIQPNTCPRRFDLGAYYADEPGHDPIRADGTCSYCGSISEEAFLAACERRDQLGPTDKTYKVYVDLQEEKPDELRVAGTSNAKESPGPGWQRHEGDEVSRDGMTLRPGDWVLLSPRGPIKHAKFYFQHLSVPGRHKFIELLNAKRLNVGYPGRFYVLPYFCVPVEKDQ